MKLLKRIASSPAVNRSVAGLFAAWLRLVWATAQRDCDGWDEVARLVDRHGAVILVIWHQRILMTPRMFDLSLAPCQSLTASARAGRLVGWIHRAFGYGTVPMPKGGIGAAEIRTVLSGLKDGVSIAISPDGPRGPARAVKPVPIQWARSSQVPIVVFTFSARRFWTWRTWDRMMFPLPFTRLCLLWRRWDRNVPKRLNPDQTDALSVELGAFMDAVTAEADRRVGHPAPQL